MMSGSEIDLTSGSIWILDGLGVQIFMCARINQTGIAYARLYILLPS